jgi:peptidoglycan hydrolase-like protein with peptidoglycan-binding domain
MTAKDARLGTWVFLVLMAGAATNLFFFQGLRLGAGLETAATDRTAHSAREAAPALQQPAETHVAVTPPQPTPASPPRTTGSLQALAPGADRAEIIRGVQRELNTRGFSPGQPDGVAGLVTRAAIMAYEYDYGLSLTGEPSEELLRKIVLGTSGPAAVLRNPPQVKGAEAEGVVRQVKQQLSALGYASGKPDGKLTEEVVRAIRDFENDEKLPESGRISAQLVTRLIKRQGQEQAAAPGKAASR